MVWKSSPLGEICLTSSGGTPDRKNKLYFEGGNIPWVKSGELNNNLILKTDECITQLGLENSSAKVFPKGTLLIALYGATIGKMAFLGIDAATNQAVCGLFENKTLSLDYLYYYLLLHRPTLIRQGIGGAQPNISQTILKKLIIHYPERKDNQEKIVEGIKRKLNSIDIVEHELQDAFRQTEILRQSILKEALEGRL